MSNQNRTPLRRVSHGTLSALARSQGSSSGTTGLEFLVPAMKELSEELDFIVDNVDGLNDLERSLESFNEAFASYLYVMKMNTLCVEWPEAPNASSFLNRIEELERGFANKSSNIQYSSINANNPNDTIARVGEISYAVPSAPPPTSPSPPPTAKNPSRDNPRTTAAASASSGGNLLRKAPATKTQMTPKEKKARAAWIDKIIQLAPVEYRGSNPALRKAAEEVLAGIIEADQPIRPPELVKSNVLPPVMVNKCLIAFVAAKIVQKEMMNGAAFYQLSELAFKDKPQ